MANFTINKTSGSSGTNEIRVTATENTGRNNRTGMLIINGIVNGEPKEIAVDIIQKGELSFTATYPGVLANDITKFEITGWSNGHSIEIIPDNKYRINSVRFSRINGENLDTKYENNRYQIIGDPGSKQEYIVDSEFIIENRNTGVEPITGIITFKIYGDNSSQKNFNIRITQNGTGESITVKSPIVIDTSGKVEDSNYININSTGWEIKRVEN